MPYGDDDVWRAVRRLSDPAFTRRLGLTPQLFDQLDILRRAGAFAAVERFSALSSSLPSGFQPPVLGLSSEVSRLLTGPSTLTALTEAARISNRLADIGAARFIATMPDFSRLSIGSDLIRLSTRLSDATQVLAGATLPWQLERATEVGTRAWRMLVGGLGDDSDHLALVRASFAGVDTVATASTAVLVSEDEDDTGDIELLGPTLAVPVQLRAQLHGRLAALDPSLPRKLNGAWERVSTAGPDAVSQAAHSLQELVDWTLRLAAPDEDVLRWHATTNRPETEVHEGRPTRALRGKYLLRNRPQDQTPGRLYLRSLSDLTETLQHNKHGLEPVSEQVAGLLILTVESCLGFFLHE